MTLNGGGTLLAITLAQARDLSITSASPIKTLKVSEWLDTDGTEDVITTPTLGTFTDKGALQASIHADTITKVAVSGALSGADIRTTGKIGTVTAASANDSYVYAGVRSDLTEALPESLGDFTNPGASIKSVSIKGSFEHTRVAAPLVNKALLGAAFIGPDAVARFGLAADRVGSASGSTSIRGPYRFSNLQSPEQSFGLIDFGIVVL
jgi:hypothetical protein